MNRIAVLIPCFNEALTIRKVVEDLRGVIQSCGRFPTA